MEKPSNREFTCVLLGTKLSNGNITGAANEWYTGERETASEGLVPHLCEVSNMEQWGVHIIRWKQESFNMFFCANKTSLSTCLSIQNPS